MTDEFKLAADELQPLDISALRFEWVDTGAVKPNIDNWRIHPPQQSTALNKLIFSKKGVRWAGAVLINDRRMIDGWDEAEAVWTLIDGHDRHRLASIHGQKVPALIGSWTPEQERIILSTLDPIAALADTDAEAWGNLLQSVQSSDSDIQQLLDTLAQRAGVFGGVDFDDLTGDTESNDDDKKSFAITIIVRDMDEFEIITEKVRALIDENKWDVELKA